MRSICSFLTLFLTSVLWADDPDLQIYKEVDGYSLNLHIFRSPAHISGAAPKPAIVFFFGGGWAGGTPTQFYPQCEYLADRGMVAMAAEYRVKSRHNTTPFECVMDGKSALRWIRKNAAKLGVDPERIGAGGGSAGGHVAAAVATVPGLNEEGEDLSISCLPDTLVLFNPVYDNGPGGFGYPKLKDRYREISPMHNLREGMPPTIVFLGDQDRLIPVSTAEKFRDEMRKLGNRSELVVYPGQSHGFFNQGKPGGGYLKTLQEMDKFLNSLGWLEKY
ncbi:alpha/beta hydrolase [Opitutales bacterium]|nr:alpha/beta hydrolase [Opitutales bacterium]MDB3958329.1 alpha/beta hydrolase [Opitutales bacterium]